MDNLTELWEQEKLENGFYYVKDCYGTYCIDCYENNFYGFIDNRDHEISEILAKVPGYEEYLESESHCAVYSEVNKGLKKRLANARKTIEELKGQISNLSKKVKESDKNAQHWFEVAQKKAQKYDNIKVNGNYPDKISKLQARIKHLSDLLDNQDKEKESARFKQGEKNGNNRTMQKSNFYKQSRG